MPDIWVVHHLKCALPSRKQKKNINTHIHIRTPNFLVLWKMKNDHFTMWHFWRIIYIGNYVSIYQNDKFQNDASHILIVFYVSFCFGKRVCIFKHADIKMPRDKMDILCFACHCACYLFSFSLSSCVLLFLLYMYMDFHFFLSVLIVSNGNEYLGIISCCS